MQYKQQVVFVCVSDAVLIIDKVLPQDVAMHKLKKLGTLGAAYTVYYNE